MSRDDYRAQTIRDRFTLHEAARAQGQRLFSHVRAWTAYCSVRFECYECHPDGLFWLQEYSPDLSCERAMARLIDHASRTCRHVMPFLRAIERMP